MANQLIGNYSYLWCVYMANRYLDVTCEFTSKAMWWRTKGVFSDYFASSYRFQSTACILFFYSHVSNYFHES